MSNGSCECCGADLEGMEADSWIDLRERLKKAESRLEYTKTRLEDALDTECVEAGFSPIGLDHHDEMELKLEVNGHEGSVFISREFWDGVTKMWDDTLKEGLPTPLHLLAYHLYQVDQKGKPSVRWWCMDEALKAKYLDEAGITSEAGLPMREMRQRNPHEHTSTQRNPSPPCTPDYLRRRAGDQPRLLADHDLARAGRARPD